MGWRSDSTLTECLQRWCVAPPPGFVKSTFRFRKTGVMIIPIWRWGEEEGQEENKEMEL